VREKIASMAPEVMRPAALVTGEDLIASGYAPGPRFKEILSAVEDGQLEGRLRSREEAIEFLLQQFPLP
jgi:poly(A) polymerase